MVTPPLATKFPGVIGLPSAVKKYLRGPSELKRSTWLLLLNGLGYGPAGLPAIPLKAFLAGVAATLKAYGLIAAEWPWVSPAVLKASRPRLVATCRKRGCPEYFTTTIREPARIESSGAISIGSCVPV